MRSFFENQEEHLAGVLKFLGLNHHFKPSTAHQKIGSTRNLKFGLNWLLYGLISKILNAPIIHILWKKIRKKIERYPKIWNGP